MLCLSLLLFLISKINLSDGDGGGGRLMQLGPAEAQFPNLLLYTANSSSVFNIKMLAIYEESNGDWSLQTSGFLGSNPTKSKDLLPQ